MARKFVTDSGIKTLYSLKELMLKAIYLEHFGIQRKHLNHINVITYADLSRTLYNRILEYLRKEDKSENLLIPTYFECCRLFFGVHSESEIFLKKQSVLTHKECLDLFLYAANHFLTKYQRFRSLK